MMHSYTSFLVLYSMQRYESCNKHMWMGFAYLIWGLHRHQRTKKCNRPYHRRFCHVSLIISTYIAFGMNSIFSKGMFCHTLHTHTVVALTYWLWLRTCFICNDFQYGINWLLLITARYFGCLCIIIYFYRMVLENIVHGDQYSKMLFFGYRVVVCIISYATRTNIQKTITYSS